MSVQFHMLSVDLEDWYQSAYLRDFVDNDNAFPRIEQSTDKILKIFLQHQTSATFFVLGSIAEKHPALIKRIAEAGHEIASHGYSHTPLYNLTPESFRNEIIKTNQILEQITSVKPKGYRAPYASLNQQTAWALKIITDEFVYDSSIFPMKTPLYGVAKAPLGIYRIAEHNVLEDDNNSNLIEIPFSIYKASCLSIPCTGGIYVRFLPFSMIKYFFSSIAKNRAVNFYFHPWETDTEIPRIKVPIKNRIISYYNVGSYPDKINKLLNNFRFCSIENYLKLNKFVNV
ncbi:MAG TPA: polysaccharide deacetylase family protein [Bacteroidales bacterium]|nr:polysaccharide deacetylase family protein [Bacteroidales bacterium]